MENKEILKELFRCAELYHENLEGRSILLISSNNSLNRISTVEAAFGPSNFLHLTGVKFEKGAEISPSVFYSRCLNRRLSASQFILAEDGTSELKLSVLPEIFGSKHLSAKMIGDFHDRRQALFTDKLAGNIRCCVGLVFNSDQKVYVPNTVLRTDMRDSIENQQRIILTYRKSIDDDQYSELVYKAKNISWSRVSLPSEFSYISLPEE